MEKNKTNELSLKEEQKTPSAYVHLKTIIPLILRENPSPGKSEIRESVAIGSIRIFTQKADLNFWTELWDS